MSSYGSLPSPVILNQVSSLSSIKNQFGPLTTSQICFMSAPQWKSAGASYLWQSEKREKENSPHCWQFHRCNFPRHSGSQGKYVELGRDWVSISTSSSHCSLTFLTHWDPFYKLKSKKCWISSSMSPLAKTARRLMGNSTQPHDQPPHSRFYKLHGKKRNRERKN